MKLKIIILLVLGCLSVSVSGQKSREMNNITGIVTDSLLKPVAGAVVFIDNKKTGFSTNEKGFYSVMTKTKSKFISVSYPGYHESKTEINGRTTINFELREYNMKVMTSNDTIGQKTGLSGKNRITTRGNEKSAAEPELQKGKFSNYRDIYDLIRTELTGVRVSGSNIVVMGSATFGGSNEPLLVVDGIPVNQINDIFPGDVKSVRLLKGSSAAGYGMRGANGVILITTLRGSDKK